MSLRAERIPLCARRIGECHDFCHAFLVLMRHGESEGNHRNVFTGWIDLPLTDAGRAEAGSAAALMKEAGLVFDRAFASDLARARESAEIVVAHLGGSAPLETRVALRERDYGALAGRDKTVVFREFGDDLVQCWRRSYDKPPPGGESLKDTLGRVRPFFKTEIEPLLQDGRAVLVVAHGSSLRALVVLIEQRAERRIGQVEIGTGETLCYCVRRR